MMSLRGGAVVERSGDLSSDGGGGWGGDCRDDVIILGSTCTVANGYFFHGQKATIPSFELLRHSTGRICPGGEDRATGARGTAARSFQRTRPT